MAKGDLRRLPPYRAWMDYANVQVVAPAFEDSCRTSLGAVSAAGQGCCALCQGLMDFPSRLHLRPPRSEDIWNAEPTAAGANDFFHRSASDLFGSNRFP